MSPDALSLIVIVLAGCLILSVAWQVLVKRDHLDDHAAEESHRALMREVRRHG